MISQFGIPRRPAALLFSAVLLLLAFGPAAAQDRAGFPAITVEPRSLDFGTLPQEQALTQTVEISNVGGAPLELGNIESTCGCTVAKPEKTSLAPGESTHMVVTFSSKQFQGKQFKTVRIHSNDPAESVVEIQVKAFVKVPLVFTPGNKMVGFGQLRAGEAEPHYIKLESTDGIALDVKPIRVNEEKLKVEVRNTKSGLPTEKLLVVELADGVAPGAIREILTFETNVPEHPTIDIDVAAQVLADVQVFPQDVNFRYVRRDQVLERMFELKMPEGTDLKITSATVDLPKFKVTKIEKNDHTGHYNIFVEGTPLPMDDERVIKAKGRMMGKLKIAVNDPKFPMLEATIKYLVRL
jgi:hypothetical protein